MVDFKMYSGDTKILQVTVTDESGVAVNVGSPVEITWQLSRKVSSPPVLIKMIGDGISVVDAPTGKFEIALEPEDTAELRGDYYQEIEINDNGIISTVLTGTVTIEPDAIKV